MVNNRLYPRAFPNDAKGKYRYLHGPKMSQRSLRGGAPFWQGACADDCSRMFLVRKCSRAPVQFHHAAKIGIDCCTFMDSKDGKAVEGCGRV